MFEDILKKLNKINAPVIGKAKIPAAGVKAFEAILKSKGIIEGESAIKIALSEFVKYNNNDEEVLKAFEHIIKKEFSGLRGAKLIKAKTKALKELWETEAKALFGSRRRNKWISIRVTEDEYNQILKEANKEGLDLSNYVRKKLGLRYEF